MQTRRAQAHLQIPAPELPAIPPPPPLHYPSGQTTRGQLYRDIQAILLEELRSV